MWVVTDSLLLTLDHRGTRAFDLVDDYWLIRECVRECVRESSAELGPDLVNAPVTFGGIPDGPMVSQDQIELAQNPNESLVGEARGPYVCSDPLRHEDVGLLQILWSFGPALRTRYRASVIGRFARCARSARMRFAITRSTVGGIITSGAMVELVGRISRARAIR